MVIQVYINIFFLLRKQAGNSPTIEFMGFKEWNNFLLGYGIVITSFTSDRHVSIASNMWKVLSSVDQNN